RHWSCLLRDAARKLELWACARRSLVGWVKPTDSRISWWVSPTLYLACLRLDETAARLWKKQRTPGSFDGCDNSHRRGFAGFSPGPPRLISMGASSPDRRRSSRLDTVAVLDLAREGLLALQLAPPDVGPDLHGLARPHAPDIGHVEVTGDSDLAGIDHAEDRIGC